MVFRWQAIPALVHETFEYVTVRVTAVYRGQVNGVCHPFTADEVAMLQELQSHPR